MEKGENLPSQSRVLVAIRIVTALWSIYIGYYYTELPGGLAGFLLSCSSVLLALFVSKPVWKLVVYQRILDILVVCCCILASFQKRVLLLQLYTGLICFVALHHLQYFVAQRSVERRKLRLLSSICFYNAIGLTALLTILSTGQRHIIYPGTFTSKTVPYSIPESLNLQAEHASIRTIDGIVLRGWLLKPTPTAEERISQAHPGMPRVTLWFLYGNGSTYVDYLDSHIPRFQKAYPNLQVFSHAYRGFLGGRQDRAHEDGIKKDVDAAADFLRQRNDVDKDHIIGFGHSLGGALLIHALRNHPNLLSAAILSNTFTSIPEVLPYLYLGFLSPLITEQWNSYKALEEAANAISLPPLLFISSRQDEQIPPEHTDRLFRVAVDSAVHRVDRLDLPHGTHNDYGDPVVVFSRIQSFLTFVFHKESL